MPGPDDFVEEYNVKPTFDEDGVQVGSAIGKDGKEYPDPVPTAPPIGYNQPPDLMTMIRKMVHHELHDRMVEAEGYETFEESDDFDTDEDGPDPQTPYEAVFNPPPAPKAPEPDKPLQPQPGASPAPSPAPNSAVTEGGAGGGSPKEAPPAPPATKA